MGISRQEKLQPNRPPMHEHKIQKVITWCKSRASSRCYLRPLLGCGEATTEGKKA